MKKNNHFLPKTKKNWRFTFDQKMAKIGKIT